MSADPSDPDELVRWIAARGVDDPDTFVPRRDYRRYLLDHLQRAAERAPDGTLSIRQDRVTGIEVADGRCRVRLASGAEELADHVVLAIGNPPPGVPEPLGQLAGHPAWVPDPWAPDALVPPAGLQQVVLVGTGLTMVDVAITLARATDPDTRFLAVSRHGIVPTAHVVHQPQRPLSVIDLDRDGTDVRALAERVRARAVDKVGAEYPDEDWREVIDAIRPYANALWRRYDAEQQRCFLNDVLRQWDVHRHRMSPPTAARFAQLVDAGTLVLDTGRVGAVEVHDGRSVDLQLDGDGAPSHVRAQLVVNCTGPGRPWQVPANPVVTDLFEQGLARPDPHGLGLDTTPEGCLIGADGQVVPQVLVIGPPRRGTLFETTAVPELRSQALHIADHVVAGVGTFDTSPG